MQGAVVDDVRGVGVIKMMMVDDVGEGGVQNDRKSDDLICGWPLTYMTFIIFESATLFDCSSFLVTFSVETALKREAFKKSRRFEYSHSMPGLS